MSAHLDYDVFVLIETWLNADFCENEFFDPNLFNVYRKDRDFIKIGLSRGGGVLIAVQRRFRSSLVHLENVDSLLDQLCVVVQGHTNIYICASYIPPSSVDSLYKAHVDNITALVCKHSGSNFCVLGDFNLPSIEWSYVDSNYALIPKNINSFSESYLVDCFLSLGFIQINSFLNKFFRILDLVFISDNMHFTLHECLDPLSSSCNHHIPLIIGLEFYSFKSLHVSNQINSFCFKRCNFNIVDNEISLLDWDSLFTGINISSCFDTFKTKMYEIFCENVPRVSKKCYRVPWYTRKLKRLKNLRNKFLRKFKLTSAQAYRGKYLRYSKKFKQLSKILQRNYIRKFESDIKSNPKAFWRYVKSKKSCSNIPSD
ncbi:PREDICTED: uncharacterized protein LOC108382279 [Rhagoletis zephyria]|uniref:uncharacterized protein LOC108382279 n=1 Tax=Rhagoletis zephyria TaxID=28612 RepID=UPI0008116E0E|nr:PREDICTED: uncharacterized protein LOC108382279 [Rhagoletis zephyria]